MAYHQATVRPLPMEVRTITGGGTQNPTITIYLMEASARLLTGGHSSLYSRCPRRCTKRKQELECRRVPMNGVKSYQSVFIEEPFKDGNLCPRNLPQLYLLKG
ncbi:hypothetical protein AVEN_247560-1 [Araneus ventricosus]|uniref:Uncharacterized protein n=1 Tax=Araneus ventricosus TaxID=182803 RepID=A0A4Y2DB51_ARAVE|nr:hypothetical protein AVEN_247560-1 [Araneus ventricosus]